MAGLCLSVSQGRALLSTANSPGSVGTSLDQGLVTVPAMSFHATSGGKGVFQVI